MEQKNYRTKTKDLINEFILKHHDITFSASDVFEYLKNCDSTVNVTTVYRNMDRLVDNGILIRRKTEGEDAAWYQVVSEDSDCDHHIHLQCSNCGKLFHMECDFMDEIQEHLLREHKFFLDCKLSLLKGLCETCRKLKKS
ncbi:MAG: transcriptional repressor [Treponema sp.]|nr:transcriptional repressor [Treponema sp.]